jgi:riboflavin transporter 2
MVHLLPEGWNLPSYVMASMQLAIITPIIYALVNKFFPGDIQRREIVMIYIIMGVGITSLTMLVFFWKSTVNFAGADRSLASLILIFSLSMVDTTSCIVYLPYMSRFKEEYIPAYIAGEEASGLITGMVGFIQGSGGEAICNNATVERYNETTGQNYTEHTIEIGHREPRFSVEVFFVIVILVMLISMASFTFLNFTSYAKSEKVGKFGFMKEKEMVELNGNAQDFPPLINEENEDEPKKNDMLAEYVEPVMPRNKLLVLGGLQMWNALFIFGVYPSVLSYSCLPYSPLTYTLVMRLICVVNPAAAILSMFIQAKNPRTLILIVASSSVVASYHIVLASLSPDPPLEHYTIGAVIAVSDTLSLQLQLVDSQHNI